MERYDVIVLGAGGIGSAAMYHLAMRGARVLGIDAIRPPHTSGSSHGQTRVIRQAYFEHPNYVPLLRESYRLWRELEAHTGKELFKQIGLIEIGPEDGMVVPGVLSAARQHHLEIERLNAEEIEKRWPAFRVAHDQVGVYEPTAGYLLVEDCVEAHLQAAEAAGAKFLIDKAVEADGRLAWLADEHEVQVNLAHRGLVTADRLVITAGSWAGQLLAQLSLELRVLRKSLFWFKTDSSAYEAANGLPVYLFELPQGIFYGFPKLDRQGVKVAEHTGGHTVANPEIVDRSLDMEERDRLVHFLSAHLPGVSNEVTAHTVCLYTMSPDEHFIVDRYPGYPNVVFAAGLSGHGFKFTPVLGRALAELALDGGTNFPIEFFSLTRFT